MVKTPRHESLPPFSIACTQVPTIKIGWNASSPSDEVLSRLNSASTQAKAIEGYVAIPAYGICTFSWSNSAS